MQLKTSIPLVSLLAASAFVMPLRPAFGLTLASQGEAKAVIVLGPDATKAERYAAAELASYLHQATGAQFSVTDQPSDGMSRILVGQTAEAKKTLKTVDWPTLRRRFPHLALDIVQRRDLATISRAMDLSRSDHEFMPHTDVIASQTALYGLSYWTPLSGTGVPHRPGRDYVAFSGLSPSFCTAIFPALSDVPIRVEPPADYPWDWLRRVLATNRRAQPFFRGDFYPLLKNTASNQHWGAMQFHRADLGAGMVLVFRRPDSPFTTARFHLRGLAEGCVCRLEPSIGGDLRLDGGVLEVVLAEAPAVAVVFYRTAQLPKEAIMIKIV